MKLTNKDYWAKQISEWNWQIKIISSSRYQNWQIKMCLCTLRTCLLEHYWKVNRGKGLLMVPDGYCHPLFTQRGVPICKYMPNATFWGDKSMKYPLESEKGTNSVKLFLFRISLGVITLLAVSNQASGIKFQPQIFVL